MEKNPTSAESDRRRRRARPRPWLRRILIAAGALAVAAGPAPRASAASPDSGRVAVRFVADEAEAVLAILDRRAAHEAVRDEDWQRLFHSEGYVRLARREASMHRAFSDSSFRAFVLSDSIAQRREALARTLNAWRGTRPDSAAARALTYLPAQARIRARIYPVIKPRSNSFVFEVSTDPAIFMFLDPEVTPAKLENTLAHELHHIGYGSGCPVPSVKAALDSLPPEKRDALDWASAFGEGFAMLAAAGGPDIHPHATSPAADRERWDADMARYPEDFARVERFLTDILERRLTAQQRDSVGFSFFGIQGPWYTVGWKMAVVIEKQLGRDRLIECMCDRRRLFPSYNEAAAALSRSGGETLPVWSAETLAGL